MVARVLKINKNIILTIPNQVIILAIDSRRKIQYWFLASFESFNRNTHNLSKKIMMFNNKIAEGAALQVSKFFLTPYIVCVSFHIVMCQNNFPGLKRD